MKKILYVLLSLLLTCFINVDAAISVQSPNGGENWRVGTNQNITWTSDSISDVKIEYSVDNGLNWISITNSTPANTGSFNWNIPVAVSSNVLIKISNVLNLLEFDESDAVFSIYNPSVTVLSPNGGENWRVGTNQNITWTSNDIVNVKLEYTIDNGTNWTNIEASVNAALGTYTWTIPNAVSGTVKVRVSDVLEAGLSDVSDSDFSIYNPAVTLTSPNGGELWRVGTTQNITWTSNDIINVKLEYTVDGGTNWNLVVASTNAAAGIYAWTIPNAVSGTVKVRISDVTDALINDVSDANFSIYNPSVTLTAPNGGENWRVGTNQNITWTSNNITNVKLEYTVDGGTNWNLVAASTNAAAGSYAWTIPNVVSGTVQVRVSDVLEAALNDVSDADFAIYNPSVTLTAPNGGENWRVGTNQNITWTSNNITNVKLEYTVDNGTNWNLVLASTNAAAGSYAWTIPNAVSGTVKVRVSDVLEAGLNDISDADFAIYNPSVTLTAPNGGENWRVGVSQNITWTSNNITDVKLEYTVDNGANWNLVVASTNAAAASYAWTIPNAVSGTVKVRVSDVLEAALNDVSDADFAIYNPNITVTSPNGGENWRIGTLQNITWTSNDVTNVKLEYTVDNGTNWTVITASENAALGTYAWTIPNDVSGTVKVRISDVLEAGLNDVSDADFSIYFPNITVTAPNGGENWRIGTLQNITWTSNNILNVKIEYTINNGADWTLVTAGTDAAAGSYTWTIPNNISNTVKIRISDVLEAGINDISNANFSIYNPSITLTSPNGGENWRVGTSQNITWTSNNIADVKLEYSTNNGTDWNLVIASTNAAAGSYAWTIANAVSGTVLVRVSDVLEASLNDVSDAVFSIYNPSVTVLAPNGGESWRAGTLQNITWTSNNIINVKIEYTTNNGTDWNLVIASTNAAAGSYGWTVSNAISATVKVRISDVLEAGVNDVSNGVFSIFNPSITVLSPNGGESWRIGKQKNITWVSNNISNVKIEYTINNGVDWSTIIASVAANSGSYTWTVPDGASTNCKVRISDVLEPGVNDLSNNTFTVYSTSLTLTSPDGGENWRVGTLHNITWNYTNISNIKIEYSADNGGNWIEISANTLASAGSYLWIVPNTVSSNCIVKVTDIEEPLLNDNSNGIFTIYQPAVTVLSPNSGEKWRVGTSQNITWTSNNIANIKIDYTTNNGTDWFVVAASLPAATGTYAWTIPNNVSIYCKIRISDVLEPAIMDESNATFTIFQPAITLISPNGGESWRIGTQQNITWTSNDIINIKIEYTTNDGSDWLSVNNSVLASLGTYSWTIPNTVSANCKVRLSDVLEPSLSDISNNTFVIYQPAITLTSPNGGENWRVGTNQNITWTSTNITNIKIEYTTNNGADWTNVNAGISAALGSFNWTIPNTVSVNCKVRISDVLEPTQNDESNGTFIIYQPTVTLTSPNGGENWRVGTQKNITWTSNNVTNVKIEYTTNSGTDWFVINASTPAAAGLFVWDIPNAVSSNCKVRISDAAEPAIIDESNGLFSIYQPAILVTSPDGGENWRVGTNQNITWNSNNITSVKIEYTTNNGTEWLNVIASTPANTGSYVWTIPNTVSSNCKVKISDVVEPTLNDISNAIFSIFQPTITVISPNGGESWQIGTNQSITWTSTNITNVKIEYTLNDGTDWNLVTASTDALTGSYLWTVPNSVSANCKIRISDVLEPGMYDLSNNSFTIFNPGVTVTSPNGGENWRNGTQKVITWVSNNIANVKLEYSTNSGTDWFTIIASTPAAIGTYDWTVPNTVSSTCIIRISDVLDVNVFDVSNATFTIYQPALTVSSPDGGEIWRAGTIHNITWVNNFVTNAKIEYSTNNGTDWLIVTESTPANTGTYAWTVPGTVSASCKVRISDALEPAIFDISNNVFEIYQPGVTLTSPNGGELWRVGTLQNITWNSINIVNIKLEYTVNNGNNWQQIVTDIPASQGSYQWTIPNTVGLNCKVRISDVLEPDLNDVSNNVFTIYQPGITISSPNGGENWRVGTQQNITWNSNNIASLNLEYSTDNGLLWLPIVSGVPGSTGSYAWIIPNTPSINCIVKISDVLEPAINDTSDMKFVIFQPAITLATPNGGELWRVGAEENITWISNSINDITIEYTTNNGINWILIVDSVSASSNSYAWTIPNTVSGNCKVKISDMHELSLNDLSNNVFTIYQPNITVTSPNGSELWRVGTNQNITWISTNINNVKIEYSTNNGTDWGVITESTAASIGSFTWLIPNTVSANCRVKISDVLEPTMVDESNGKFTIYQPALAVISPNRGESWRVGTTQQIKWTSNNIANIKIEYTIDNGINWSVVTALTAAHTGIYSWVIPNAVSANCKIKISDISELTMNDESDSLFAIFQPGIILTSPNGGENWRATSEQNITWQSNNITNVKIEYSTNNGLNWLVVKSSTPTATGLYAWTVPVTVSASCKVRISDVNEVTMNDVSDGVFSIYQPGITVTSPNGNENWRIGTQQAITWTSVNISNVKLEYTTNNGISWIEIIASVPDSTNSYSWLVPNTASNNCKVRVSNVVEPAVKDESNSTFVIYQPSITLNKPNGGEKWRVGTNQNITWVSSYITKIKLEYSANVDTTWHVIVANLDAAAGTYKWTIPNAVSKNCKVRISDASEPTMKDESDNLFTIYQPAITVTSPVEGDYWRVGTQKEIAWTSNDIDNIKIEYTINNGTNWITVAASVLASTGKYNWVIPNTPSINCKVRLSDANDVVVNMVSDSTFTIYQPTIMVLTPNGNENWRIGTEQNITWQSTNIVNVKIEYSTNSGVEWTTVIASTNGASGKYVWTIPNTESTTCKVRVSDVLEPTMYDVSNGTFRIYQANITITAPNGGEKWRAGELESITWTSTNVSEVKIEYTTNDTTNWVAVIAGIPAGSGKYTWSVPNTPAYVTRVRVSDVTTPKVFDVSDNVFTIFQSTLNLTSPNGGEIWRGGSKKNITWTSLNIENVNIEYTINNGASWFVAAQNLPASGGTYEWTLPSDVSSVGCKIRISDASSASVFDISNAVFTINKATLLLSTPNGGENWRVGVNHYIVWSGNNIQSIKIEYSTDSGNSWLLIASDVSAASNSYVWNVSTTVSENCKIKVSDMEDYNINAISKNIFTISLTGIKLLLPNGTEYWRAGSSHYITWQTSELANLKLEYSVDGGAGWNTIASNVSANTKFYNWVIPGNFLSKNCKVRVSDQTHTIYNDFSDSVFTIYQPSITLLTPNGGEEYQIGIGNNISWISNDVDNIKIELTTNAGATWNNIVGSVTASVGNYSWMTLTNASIQCKVRLSAVEESSINDMSAQRFITFKYPERITLKKTINFGEVTEKSSYKIIGLPGDINLPIVETISGTYKTDWKAFYDNGNTESYYLEYDGTETFNFKPGRAFWITSRNGVVVSNEQNTVRIDSSNYYAIPLHAGWNIISSPFEKPVNWSNVIKGNAITLNPLLYGWNGAWVSSVSVMNPYEGYYFYNAHNRTELKLPYSPTGAANTLLAKGNINNKEIVIELLKNSESVSLVSASINDSASVDFDEHDYYAAPGNFEDISFKIYNNNLSSSYKYLFADTRPLIEEGQMFDLQTKNNTGSPLEMVWNTIPEIYKDYETYLVDRRINKFYDLKTINKIELPAYYKENSFSLLIGSENYINGIKESLLPSEYILYQNYPNPFNAGTVIRYSLPFESEINITLYNIVGQVVKEMISTKQTAGYYEQQIQMNNFASGVYFYQINAKSIDGKHNYSTTKKMVLLK
ncbi:MAG: T9SS type A sorting domain-containing protein [bacterium]